MKIAFDKVKITGVSATQKAVCVFGEPDDEINAWVAFHNLPVSKSCDHTNISISGVADFAELFQFGPQPVYVDGFSPNLNKHLHLGHLANLVVAKALKCMGVGSHWIAVLNDTMSGEVSKDESFTAYQKLCQQFDYQPDTTYLGSNLKAPPQLLHPGTDKYHGTWVFHIGEKQEVGIKSTGDASYLYQDVAVASQLNAPTLYITGSEQVPYFKTLKLLFPNIVHLPLGLVSASGKKMSSSSGNAIMATTILDKLHSAFGGPKVSWNVLAGFILKSAPQTAKKIDMETLDNPKHSPGLYVSYTLAKCQSAGITLEPKTAFSDPILQLTWLASKANLTPHFLLRALWAKAKQISQLYEKHQIAGNPHAGSIFNQPVTDLAFGMQLLGMYPVKRV